MSFRFLNDRPGGFEGEQIFTPTETFIDPVSKIRVSNPSNLIDTDFEYGLQPTKWETVELINNTPAFFSKGGDTTIPDITSITTNAGTREITVTTAFPHELDPGIPIRVSGTKSVTADGSYIINATPSITSFTYLARANQPETISIFDLFSSIITGEFFQGSQISISDAEGITTGAEGPVSDLIVRTTTKHGFGLNTPFYFLNLNSTVSQEFEAQNSTSVSFDPTNAATGINFDGSNTLLQSPIELSNSATSSVSESTITGVNISENTITVALTGEDWSVLSVGDPLYYSVTVASGFFNQNPRGIVFIKNINGIQTSTATFQVSQLPDGEPIDITSNISGFFQIADQARTFAGNNVNEETQIEFEVVSDAPLLFDGSNNGSIGDPEGEDFIEEDTEATVIGYSGSNITVGSSTQSLEFYQGAMLKYETTDTAPAELTDGNTYFVVSFQPSQVSGLFTMAIAEEPGGTAINFTSTGSGTQTFNRIGVSVDKNIIHIRDSNLEEGDMIEYRFPEDGAFTYDTDSPKQFFFINTALDEHNYRLSESVFVPISATGGNIVSTFFSEGRLWRAHTFTSVGSSTFTVQSPGTDGEVEYLILGGGGGGGSDNAGGGGGGGVLSSERAGSSPAPIEAGNYTIVVGAGGNASGANNVWVNTNGGNSSAFGLTALGGGRGANGQNATAANSTNGGSGGGGEGETGINSVGFRLGQPGTAGQGFAGGNGISNSGGGGGGAGAPGQNASGSTGGNGGSGFLSSIDTNLRRYGSGGGGSNSSGSGGGLAGSYSGGGGRGSSSNGQSAAPNTGGGGGGGVATGNTGGAGGSGIVIVRYPLTPENSDIVQASGGNSTSLLEQNGIIYVVHQFDSNGQFVIEQAPQNAVVEYLIVAGGGGAGSDNGGGGGGGGVLTGLAPVTAGTYAVSVGNGGRNSGTSNADLQARGGSSSVFGLTAIGGGWGAGGNSGLRPAGSGGSGGGGEGETGSVTQNTGGAGTAGQGNNGGNGHLVGSSGDFAGGGGGGAVAVGQNGGSVDGGAGGQGLLSNINGISRRYGAGGAGGGQNGRGGGGAGTFAGPGQPLGGSGSTGANGQNGSGGGGGGSSSTSNVGGSGGSGVVIIRYPVGEAA